MRQALDEVLRSITPVGAERVGLFDAAGRVLAEDVRSPRDVPCYANSAMDGFAVRYEDVVRTPARLRVTGLSAAGTRTLPHVGRGEAARIMTGAPVPPGADTVVRSEDTRVEGDDVIVETAGPKGKDIRLPGEDVRAGETVLESGRRLIPADVGVASSVGRTLLLVRRRPRVAIVSTGNELIDADQPIESGQVVNSNGYALAAAIEEAGGTALTLPIARDDPAEIRATFEEAARADAILSTGGVSVGDFDYVKSVMDELGVERTFWKVAQKPGKPLTFGRLAGRPYFGLPGNPVSALVCFYLYARPAIRRMAGFAAVHLPTTTAKLAHDVQKPQGLTEFVRCRLERRAGELYATSTGTQSSSVLRSMSLAHGLIVGPAAESLLREDSAVRVILLDSQSASEEVPF